jgi:hypothetical protein
LVVEEAALDDNKVLEGSAKVVQPTTVYVWGGAGSHLLAVYGFSIIEIVKDNPMGRPSTLVVSRVMQSVNDTRT